MTVRHCAAIVCVIVFLLAGHAPGASESIRGTNATVSTDDLTGAYSLEIAQPHWRLAGTVGAPVRDLQKRDGSDEIGKYEQLSFVYAGPGDPGATIRTYTEKPLVLLAYTLHDAATTQPAPFPNFTTVPADLHVLSHQNEVFAHPAFGKAVETSTPWLLFDDSANAMIISPASDFMVASMVGDGTSSIGSGLTAELMNLPKGFTHRTLIAYGQGIGKTYQAWGHALTDLSGKKRPSNDADIGLKYLGYWTDNGGTYYYNYDTDKGYAGTLLAVRDEMQRLGVPIKYMQLDSWWYEKSTMDPKGVDKGQPKNKNLPKGTWNAYGGLLKYQAHPDLFPNGLDAFQKQLGLPLITHNRWIDPKSPYHEKYKIVGLAAVDPKFWDEIGDYLKTSGVVTYEQDWLNYLWSQSPQLHGNLDLSHAMPDEMARAMRERGITMQYCMAQPRYFLQGTHYDNLTTVRTSNDRFGRNRWQEFLFVNQLAYALGEWPWSDVFTSSETPNFLLSTLSAGMVGIGDKIGQTSVENVFNCVRADGAIVKPDETIVPSDQTYVANAKSSESPIVGVARSVSGIVPTLYVFGYPRSDSQMQMTFRPADYGITSECWVYDWKNKTGKKLGAGETFSANFEGPAKNAWAYYIVGPVEPNGITLLGDLGKFASNGRQRMEAIAVREHDIIATIDLTSGEDQITVHGYADSTPHIWADEGQTGPLNYDPATKHFTITVSPEGPVAPGRITRAIIFFSR